MADHFYSIATVGAAFPRDPSAITVATSAQTSNPVEVRITDGAMTRQEAYAFLEWLSDLLAIPDPQVIPVELFTG